MNIYEFFYNTFFSIFSFIIIFVIIIPTILYHLGLYYILIGYLPNVDLIATVITKWGGPFNLWHSLYPDSVDTYAKFFTSTIINYFALIGLTYIVAKEAYDNNDIFVGWSMAFVMCLITYLLPSKFIFFIMSKLVEYTNSKLISIISGVIMVILIIFLESKLIEHFHPILIKLGKLILTVPSKIINIL